MTPIRPAADEPAPFRMPPLPPAALDLLLDLIARKAVAALRARETAERAALEGKKAG